MSHRNPYWLAFLAVIVFSTIGYTAYTGYKLYQYYRLTYRIPVQHIEWAVDQLGADQFVPHAYYQFSIDGTVYKGDSTWEEIYLNAWTAEEKIRQLSTEPIKVWVDARHPSYSALQKNFPYKQSVSTFLLWLLVVYFIGLGRVAKSYTPE